MPYERLDPGVPHLGVRTLFFFHPRAKAVFYANKYGATLAEARQSIQLRGTTNIINDKSISEAGKCKARTHRTKDCHKGAKAIKGSSSQDNGHTVFIHFLWKTELPGWKRSSRATHCSRVSHVENGLRLRRCSGFQTLWTQVAQRWESPLSKIEFTPCLQPRLSSILPSSSLKA